MQPQIVDEFHVRARTEGQVGPAVRLGRDRADAKVHVGNPIA